MLVCVNVFLMWMNSQTNTHTASPDAYRQLTSDMKYMGESEKVEYIQSRFDMISAVSIMDNIVKSSQYDSKYANKMMDREYKHLFDAYGDLYRSKTYLKYTDSIYKEYYFLKKINSEIKESSNYEKFLEEIQQKAVQLSQISIFNKEGSYDNLNIKATAKAYEDIQGIEIQYFPQEGLVKALSFRYSDLVLIFIMILLAGYIVRGEKDNGMLTLIRTNSAGRTKTAIAKIMAMGISLLIAVAALYIVNLIFCNFTYGLGSLTRSIQSIPYLMRSTMRINFIQYFVLFIFTKWIAAFICGVWILFAMFIAKRIFVGYALSLAMPLVNLLIRNAIPATSHLNVIKYSNLVSFLTTNEILGNYRKIYWFGKPVRLFWVEVIAAVIFAVIFTVLFLVTFEKAQLIKNESIKFAIGFKRKPKATTVFKQELYKLCVMNGAVFVLVLFCGFQIYNGYKAENYITAEEMFYSYYMQELTGPYDMDAYNFMQTEYEKFSPIIEAKKMMATGKISSDEYNMILSANYALNMEYGVYQTVASKINSLANNKGAQLLYETGYLKLFDFENFLDLKDYLFTALIVCITFGGLFCLEKTSGMLKVIKATPLGMDYTAKTKIKVSFIVSAVIAVMSIAPRFYQVAIGYGFKGLFVPTKSIQILSKLNQYIPVIAVILFMLILRFAVTFTMAMIVLCISQKSENYLSAVMFSLLLLEFPTLLYSLGIEGAKWFTLYPMFHLVGDMGTTAGFFCWLYLPLSALIVYLSYDFLVDEYRISKSKIC